MHFCHLLKRAFVLLFQRFSSFVKRKILILLNILIDKHFFEQNFRKVESESFLYEFLNNGDPLYQGNFIIIGKDLSNMDNCPSFARVTAGIHHRAINQWDFSYPNYSSKIGFITQHYVPENFHAPFRFLLLWSWTLIMTSP